MIHCLNCRKNIPDNKKYCCVACFHEAKRMKIKCKICWNDFVIKKCHKDLLKTCSKECWEKLRSQNAKKVFSDKWPPIFRWDALEKMTNTKRRQQKEWKLIIFNSLQRKKWDWEKEKNPRWKPVWTRVKDWHGYILVKIADWKWFKNWKFEHVYIMEKRIWREIDLKIECIHHIDWDKANNSFENLFLTTQSYHKKLHQSIFMGLIKELLDKWIVRFDLTEWKYIII